MDTETRTPQLLEQMGQRLRERRKARGFTQSQLAELLEISYQQLQKYESGKIQITVDRLLQIAQILAVPPAYFYEGFAGKKHKNSHDTIPAKLDRPLHILLVEDNPGDTLLFSKALGEYADKVEVHCIDNAENVVDFLRHHHSKYAQPQPDLMILDISMPKMNGLQLLKQIKTNRDISIIPVLIHTNSNSRKEMQEAYSSGASGFLRKSIRIVEYRERVQAAIAYWSQIVVLPTI